MTPYYQHAGITIYCADCREILPTLPKVDAIISDPPYGINFNHSGAHGRFSGQGVTLAARSRGNYPVIGDDAPFDPRQMITLCPNVILWGADHFYPRLPDSGRFLAFNKLADMEPWDSFSDVEFAWHSLEGAARIFNMKWKGIACSKVGENNGLREHPTQKPVALMKWCIEQSRIQRPARILDPYCGSGTTLFAAKEEGFRAIGIEIEEKYCEIAAKRLSQEVLQFEGARESSI